MRGEQMLDTRLLRSMPIFHGLADGELSRAAGLLRARTFPASTNLLTVEEPGELAYLILSGTVKVHVEQADGSDVILAILGPGELLGEMSLVDRIGRSASAVTMEESDLAWLDRITFWELIESIPAMGNNLVTLLSRRLRLANTRIQSLASEPVNRRVTRQILAFAHEYGQPLADGATDGDTAVRIPLRLTQTDLAELVGATRVRVNNTLMEMKRAGYIDIDKKDHRFIVKDRGRLEASLSE